MELRVWGIRVLRLPGRVSPRSSVVGRWIFRRIDQVLNHVDGPPSKPAEDTAPTPKKRSMDFKFLRWAAGRTAILLSTVTRRLQVRCGGIDPALLGTLSGIAAIAQGALGAKKFVWVPDFAPTTGFVEVKWEVSISILKLVRWTGESFAGRNRRPGSGVVL